MKRILALFFAILMLTSVVVSCGKVEEPSTTTTDTNSDLTTLESANVTTIPVETQPAGPATDTNGFVLDDLPDDLNYNNETFTVLTWSDVEHEEFYVESLTGDVVNDAIYNRNQAVEERLGIKFAWVEQAGNFYNIASFNTYIQQALLSGSHEFDLIGCYSTTVATAAANGYLYNLLDESCEYLNFDQPWWPDTLLEQSTINNKLCFASGDISMNMLYMMYVCFVNTDLIEIHHLEDPAQLVIDGKWTYDKFIEMCNGIYEDLDGNGVKSNKDRFGYMTSGIHVDPWFYGSGAIMVEKDANGQLKVSDTLMSETVVDSITKINALLHDSMDGLHVSTDVHQTAFRDEQLLFMIDRARISFQVLIQNENCHYTIVPAPKYSEEQENYYTVMGGPISLYAIPNDSVDPAKASAVMECFASESYRTTTPAVFEITLKLKYAQNDISGQMYDLIRKNASFDIGRFFAEKLIGFDLFRVVIASNKSTWVSDMKMNLKVFEKKLDNLQKAFED